MTVITTRAMSPEEYNNIISTLSDLSENTGIEIDMESITRPVEPEPEIKNITNSTLDVVDIFINLYGDKRVDYRINRAYMFITIWYPRITISNGELKHTIRDLFLEYKFVVNDDEVKGLQELTCTRTTFTEMEMIARYVFSHTNAAPFFDTGYFCFGGGSPVSISVKNLMDGKVSKLSILGLALAMDEYLKWESKDGGPYRLIKEVVQHKHSDTKGAALYTIHDYQKTYIEVLTEFFNKGGSVIANSCNVEGFLISIHPKDIDLLRTCMLMFRKNLLLNSVNDPYLNLLSKISPESFPVKEFKGKKLKNIILRSVPVEDEDSLIDETRVFYHIEVIKQLLNKLYRYEYSLSKKQFQS